MGRLAHDMSDLPDKPSVELTGLDERIAAILSNIEQEKVPERLLELASALQQALILQRRRERPN